MFEHDRNDARCVNTVVQEVLVQIPWYHHLTLLDKANE
jgi:hypothetical protein